MRIMTSLQLRLAITALCLVAEISLLMWEHFHGGIKSHHILHRADLPAFSNAWGLIVLPALAWWASTQVLKRMDSSQSKSIDFTNVPSSAIFGFTGALIAGAALAFGFNQGYETFTGYLFQTMFVLALVLPAYRAETLLGFVLGMNVVFGTVLPTAIGAVLAAFSAITHLILWPLLARGWRWGVRR